ncbi:MAG: FlgD immunoglobulin-like domain containing protein [Candidatus Eisenbacteria bacterium]|nr:FlgD immunoglobulin-like domain containing protein [Candidatus Eisenbacteria bacterium]
MHRNVPVAPACVLLIGFLLALASPVPAATTKTTTFASSSGAVTVSATPVATGDSSLLWDLEIRTADAEGPTARLSRVEASTFFVSDVVGVLAWTRYEANAAPARLRMYALDGQVRLDLPLEAPSSPVLSRDGAYLAFRSPGTTRLLDLRDGAARDLPALDRFVPMTGGALAGLALEEDVVKFFPAGAAEPRAIPLPPGVAAQALSLIESGDAAVLLVTPDALWRVDPSSGAVARFYVPADGERVRDAALEAALPLRVRVELARIEAGGLLQPSTVLLDGSGAILDRTPGAPRQIPRADFARDDRGIPWPLAPDAQHAVGNTYGEYQNYGGAPYPHPGIDVFGSPGQAVYAVRRGVVKAVLTTGGDWYWRIAIADTALTSTVPGYLYAHIERNSIAVTVGQQVELGQYLGNLAEWPNYEFTHCHFTRIEDSGATWDGNWLSVHNPHMDITQQSETEPPVFEPARGNDLLAFCANQTSSYQSPTSLHGAVDIIAHVGDRIETHYVCSVQELWYTIYPLGMPEYPVVDNKLAQRFDMTCDTYGSGQLDAMLIGLIYKDDSVCNTQGDYDYREFFHVLTNSDGDGIYEQSDGNESWDTTTLPDRQWVIRVTAIDARGNTAVDSMVVTTANGNPSGAEESASGLAAPRLLLDSVRPNPMTIGGTAARVRFLMPASDRIVLALYDANGRRVRLLRDAILPAGSHEIAWDGRDGNGRDLPPGVYFVRLQGEDLGTCRGHVILAR